VASIISGIVTNAYPSFPDDFKASGRGVHRSSLLDAGARTLRGSAPVRVCRAKLVVMVVAVEDEIGLKS